MKKIITLFFIFIFIFPIFLKADIVLIKNINGDVKIKNNTSWKSLKPGLKIDDISVLKIGKKSYVQLINNSGEIITINTEGEIVIKDFCFYNNSSPLFKKLIILKNKINKKNFANNDTTPTAVAGVRGNVFTYNQEKLKKELYWEE